MDTINIFYVIIQFDVNYYDIDIWGEENNFLKT